MKGNGTLKTQRFNFKQIKITQFPHVSLKKFFFSRYCKDSIPTIQWGKGYSNFPDDIFTEKPYEVTSIPIPTDARVTHSRQKADCLSQSPQGTEAPLICRNKPGLEVQFVEEETGWNGRNEVTDLFFSQVLPAAEKGCILWLKIESRTKNSTTCLDLQYHNLSSQNSEMCLQANTLAIGNCRSARRALNIVLITQGPPSPVSFFLLITDEVSEFYIRQKPGVKLGFGLNFNVVINYCVIWAGL